MFTFALLNLCARDSHARGRLQRVRDENNNGVLSFQELVRVDTLVAALRRVGGGGGEVEAEEVVHVSQLAPQDAMEVVMQPPQEAEEVVRQPQAPPQDKNIPSGATSRQI